jgi:outer membrane protein TolC
MALQPITQLTKVAVGEKVAKTEAGIARTQLDKASLEVKQGVEKLYFGLLITQQQLAQANAETEMLNAQLYDIESALMAGKTDAVNRTGLLAKLADQEQKTLQLNYQYQNYQDDLDELLGYLPTTPIAPLPVTDTLYTLQPLSAYISQASEQNPDVRIASQTREKAAFGVAAARKDFIPDLGVAGGYGYQNAISLLPENNFYVGVIMRWNILDFGGRRSVVNERLALQQQADTNLVYTKTHTTIAVQKAYRNVQQSTALIQVAQKAVRYRKEELKMKEDARLAGTLLKREVLATQADLAKALADLYAAQLNYRMAITALSIATGN